MKNKTFKHSGDLGDIIFSLPVIASEGGGVLYLDPNGGEKEPLVSWAQYNKTKLTEKAIEAIKPVLEAQDYIQEVRLWDPSIKVTHNLDKFRQYIKHNNLTTSHLDAFGMMGRNEYWQKTPWLKVEPKPLPDGKRIILARSCRYHGNYSFWEQLQDDVIDNAIFMALPEEFDYFLYTFPRYKGRINRLDTSKLTDLAAYIQGCELFIGNQGFPHAVAEGMKKNMINEVYQQYPSCVFRRDNVRYV